MASTVRIVAVEFLVSGADPEAGTGWPQEGVPEIAFVGRSNVGKSTLLGALFGKKGLVRTSRTPGRTQLLNFFDARIAMGRGAEVSLRFVDLPGFGYAKVAKADRGKWMPWMTRYLGERSTLAACVILVDARRGPEVDEIELCAWLKGRGVTVIPVMTKSDKLAKHERRPAQGKMSGAFGQPPLVVSSTTREGIDDLWRAIVRCVE